MGQEPGCSSEGEGGGEEEEETGAGGGHAVALCGWQDLAGLTARN